ncbi:DUF805 domain-containing protein [Streptomyces sp. NPDC047968]|uniref:DUF805 domain-containing protein n=1 Tax=unclassified Streptomyces TaxID=2593676 RepID=UPI00343C39E2
MNWYLAVLKNYVGFSGRARRTEYWMYTLFNSLATLVLYVAGMAIDTMVPYFLYAVATFLPSLAVSFRRLHDTGRPAWWLLLSFVPLVGGIILIVFLASDGQEEENRYGANPKAVPAA